ncbi:hypothetical protein [Nocardia asiatica]|uniref:hypothetical protein n=1 Tax=Nocardia asiatica TaxID=209252 RepID=UPI003EE09186
MRSRAGSGARPPNSTDDASDADDQTRSAIARRATAAGETIHNEPFPVDAAMVVDALRTADALGQ